MGLRDKCRLLNHWEAPRRGRSRPGGLAIALPLVLLAMTLSLGGRASQSAAAPLTQGDDEYVFLFKWGGDNAPPAGQFSSQFSGLAAGPDGSVYVADSGNHRIQKFAANGQFRTMWGSSGTADGQFGKSQSGSRIAVGPDGSVYVTDAGNYRIQKFSARGKFLTKWGSEGRGNGQFLDPLGIAAGPDGSVYVLDSGNSRIQRFTADGEYIGHWGSHGSGDGQLGGSGGLAVGSDGSVYVADAFNDRIQKFTADGEYITEWGSYGSGNGQLFRPNGLAVGTDGSVYVADTYNHRIQRFTANGEFDSKWGSEGSADGQLLLPRDVSVSPDGWVYVLDRANWRIQRFTASGEFVAKWGSLSISESQSYRPYGVAVAPDGSVFVTGGEWPGDIHSVQNLTTTGGFVSEWGSQGSNLGQFQFPRGIAVGREGSVYVADTYNHRIQKFTPSGDFVTGWGTYGSGYGQFRYPFGVAVGPEGSVYVADTFNNRIQRFQPDGQLLTQWGSLGNGHAEFYNPHCVAVGPDGSVYVADTGNVRIQKFAANGRFITKWGRLASADGQFFEPVGVTVGADNSVYVVESSYYGNRISRFTANGEALSVWGRSGQGIGEFLFPTDVAVGAGDLVYVVDGFNNRIQVFGNGHMSTWQGGYYNNRWLVEKPAFIRDDQVIDFSWGAGPPGSGVGADNFSVRWVRLVPFHEGRYRFTVTVNDGVRLWVGDRLAVDRWQHPQQGTYTADLQLSQGPHRLQMEYYDAGGNAHASLSWMELSTPTPTATPTATPTPTSTPTPTATPVPTSIVIGPEVGGTLISNDATQSTTVELPPGAVSQTAVVTYAFQLPSFTGDLVGIGHFFDLVATDQDTGGLLISLSLPATITVQFTAQERGPAIQDTLALYRLQDSEWSAEGIATVEQEDGVLVSETIHLGRFAVLGRTHRRYLPLILRDRARPL